MIEYSNNLIFKKSRSPYLDPSVFSGVGYEDDIHKIIVEYLQFILSFRLTEVSFDLILCPPVPRTLIRETLTFPHVWVML